MQQLKDELLKRLCDAVDNGDLDGLDHWHDHLRNIMQAEHEVSLNHHMERILGDYATDQGEEMTSLAQAKIILNEFIDQGRKFRIGDIQKEIMNRWGTSSTTEDIEEAITQVSDERDIVFDQGEQKWYSYQ